MSRSERDKSAIQLYRCCIFLVFSSTFANAQSNSLSGVGYCFSPEEPFAFKLDKSDELYETARDEHQRYLEELEQHVKCLDEERTNAISEFKSSFKLFTENYGEDAVFRYSQEREENQ